MQLQNGSMYELVVLEKEKKRENGLINANFAIII